MKYVLATDGSEASLKAATWAIQHLNFNGETQLFLIYVFPLPSDVEAYSHWVSLPTDASDERVVQISQSVMERTRKALGDLDVQIHEVTLVGNPAQNIVEFAIAQTADLVVTGTHGHSPGVEVCLGSVSNAVAHRVLCPVLIVR